MIDANWRGAHPLPVHPPGTDKNGRGRVLVVGGAEFVPGALRLTGEAALRVGAGKVQMATVGAVATALGVLVPEAAMIALPADEDGEIAVTAIERLIDPIRHCDCLVFGAGMSVNARTTDLVRQLIAYPRPDFAVVLDAAGIAGAADLAKEVGAHEGRVVLTPHHGEMAALTGHSVDQVAADPIQAAQKVADAFKAVVVLKGHETLIATPGGEVLTYQSDCVGLATGGSGDVLAGVVGGLLARGATPLVASGWGVWLHAAAGQANAIRWGAIGFLARDLLDSLPPLMMPTRIADSS